MDLKPGTRSVLAYFAFTFSRSSSARSVKKAFSTSCNRTYSSCLSQDTLSAGPAIFLKPSDILVHADENGIQSGKHRFLRISIGKKLDSGPTTHGEQGF